MVSELEPLHFIWPVEYKYTRFKQPMAKRGRCVVVWNGQYLRGLKAEEILMGIIGSNQALCDFPAASKTHLKDTHNQYFMTHSRNDSQK